MPTTGEWQDGLVHQLLLKWDGTTEVVWEIEPSISHPDIGWEVGDVSVAFSASAGREQPDLGGATPESSATAWGLAQLDTSITTSGGSLNISHSGAVDAPVGGGIYHQTDGWNVITTDARLSFDQTPEFENPLHFLPPAETWPAGVAGFEIEAPRRTREIQSIEISYWDGLGVWKGHYQGMWKDFGESGLGWPDLDDDATPTLFRGHDNLPPVPLLSFLGDHWITLNAAQAQGVVDAVQAGSTPDPAEFAMAGWVHLDEWHATIWGDLDYSENPGLPTVWWRIRFRTCRYRFIYDRAVQPPQRVFPREDGLLGPGARRNYPPPRSRQHSPRIQGGYL